MLADDHEGRSRADQTPNTLRIIYYQDQRSLITYVRRALNGNPIQIDSRTIPVVLLANRCVSLPVERAAHGRSHAAPSFQVPRILSCAAKTSITHRESSEIQGGNLSIGRGMSQPIDQPS